MQKLKVLTISIILLLSFSLAGSSFDVSARPLAAISPTLGAAESYSVLAGSIVTNTGPTTVSGDLGISPSIGVPPHYTGFPPGVVGPPGEIHDADAPAAAAQAGDTTAFALLDQACDITYPGVQDLTLVSPLGPGTYCADAFLLTGNLTLSGSGVWIFKSASTLTTSPGSSVTGGDPCNVWWRLVSSGTLFTNTSFIGNILALTDINLQTGASLNGRALVQTGQVTLDSNAIYLICAAAPTQTPTPTVTATATATYATRTPTVTRTVTATSWTRTPTLTLTGTARTATQTVTVMPATLTGTSTHIPPPAATSAPTATLLPVVTGLPGAGGAPIRNENFPWSWVIVGGFSAIALALGIRAYRSTYRPKQ
jgi:hypothetical protein